MERRLACSSSCDDDAHVDELEREEVPYSRDLRSKTTPEKYNVLEKVP
jgi:hypothetical protein